MCVASVTSFFFLQCGGQRTCSTISIKKREGGTERGCAGEINQNINLLQNQVENYTGGGKLNVSANLFTLSVWMRRARLPALAFSFAHLPTSPPRYAPSVLVPPHPPTHPRILTPIGVLTHSPVCLSSPSFKVLSYPSSSPICLLPPPSFSSPLLPYPRVTYPPVTYPPDSSTCPFTGFFTQQRTHTLAFTCMLTHLPSSVIHMHPAARSS